ncbi:SubName: Full=Uncharacterized protein {ECO:0000313/EMBL:CCA67737.1} [Serendipita indica DSM 11827]|nr:SubName: Full=Uncharacterized protein {ECO:0000313/EMBL:CCA67737.1} [Serendipita indica DSM 11827]
MDMVSEEDLPWTRIEGDRIRDDEDVFPTMHAWSVSFTDPKSIKVFQEYTRTRPLLWEALQHLKLVKKVELDSSGMSPSDVLNPLIELIGTIYHVIVGLDLARPPEDVPVGMYSEPMQCIVPSTPALTRGQLASKNKLWPTVFSPHLARLPVSIERAEVQRMVNGMRMAINEAVKAKQHGEVPIAACLLPDQYLNVTLLAHDTRTSTHHPLKHSVINIVRALSDQVLLADVAKINNGEDNPMRNPAMVVSLQNGEGYQLTNRTLYLTHEPCLMCTMALVHSRVKEIIYIHPMPKTGGCGGHAIVPELPTINHRFTIWRWKEDSIHSIFGNIRLDFCGVWRAEFARTFDQAYVGFVPKKMSSSYALARKAAQMLPISTFVHMTEEDDFGRPLPNISPLFNSPTADLVLSSSDSCHFRVHRAILSEASPIFYAALSTLSVHKPTDPPPVQDLTEDGETILILLQYVYPIPNPQVSSLTSLRLALIAAQRYEITSAIEASRATLAFDILSTPLETPCLENLSAKDFLKLVRLHQSRAEAAISVLESMAPMPHDCCGNICPSSHADERSDNSSSSSTRNHNSSNDGLPYVRWFVTWKAAAVRELKARPRSDIIFDHAYLLAHVKRATRHCHECAPTFMANATQDWLKLLKNRIDALPDVI